MRVVRYGERFHPRKKKWVAADVESMTDSLGVPVAATPQKVTRTDSSGAYVEWTCPGCGAVEVSMMSNPSGPNTVTRGRDILFEVVSPAGVIGGSCTQKMGDGLCDTPLFLINPKGGR